MQFIERHKARWRLVRWQRLCRLRGQTDNLIERLTAPGIDDYIDPNYIDRLRRASTKLTRKIETLEHKERQHRVPA